MAESDPPPGTSVDHRGRLRTRWWTMAEVSVRDRPTGVGARARDERIHVLIGNRHRTRALTAALLGALALTGCTTTDHLDEYNEVKQGDARPAVAPPASAVTEGRTVDVDGPVRAMVASGDGVAVQLADRDRLLWGRVTGTEWVPGPVVDLPAGAGDAAPGIDGGVVVPYGDGFVLVDPRGETRRVDGLGAVTAVAQLRDGRVATADPSGTVTIRAADGSAEHEVPGLSAVDQLVVARDGSLSALSRPDTVFASIDPRGPEAGPKLRAGRGAGRAAVYSGDSTIVSDTVGDALLVYSTSPVSLHQMFPVPHAPWAVADDPTRSVVWVTSTGSNRVLAYDLRDGQGVERADVATVRQPDSMVVTDSGTLVVASATDGVLHLLTPTLADTATGGR